LLPYTLSIRGNRTIALGIVWKPAQRGKKEFCGRGYQPKKLAKSHVRKASERTRRNT